MPHNTLSGGSMWEPKQYHNWDENSRSLYIFTGYLYDRDFSRVFNSNDCKIMKISLYMTPGRATRIKEINVPEALPFWRKEFAKIKQEILTLNPEKIYYHPDIFLFKNPEVLDPLVRVTLETVFLPEVGYDRNLPKGY